MKCRVLIPTEPMSVDDMANRIASFVSTGVKEVVLAIGS